MGQQSIPSTTRLSPHRKHLGSHTDACPAAALRHVDALGVEQNSGNGGPSVTTLRWRKHRDWRAHKGPAHAYKIIRKKKDQRKTNKNSSARSYPRLLGWVKVESESVQVIPIHKFLAVPKIYISVMCFHFTYRCWSNVCFVLIFFLLSATVT